MHIEATYEAAIEWSVTVLTWPNPLLGAVRLSQFRNRPLFITVVRSTFSENYCNGLLLPSKYAYFDVCLSVCPLA